MANPKRQPRDVLYGSLLLAGLVVLAGLIFALADIRQAFVRSYTLVAIFPKAPDLNVDAAVLVAGRYSGRVKEVALLPMGYDTVPTVSVLLELPHRVRSQIRSDSYALLTSITTLGERVVDIIPGSPQMPMLGDGDTLAVHIPEPGAELAARVQRAQAELDALQQTVEALRAPLDARMRSLEPARRELAAARREFAALRRDFETGPAGSALRDAELRAALQRLNTHVDEIGAAFATAIGTTDGVGRELRDAVAELSRSFQDLSADVAALQQRADDPAGFIGRLRQDTAVEMAWRGTQQELDSLVAAVRRNPFRYFRLRLF
jgi:ABC-type transporter Mla subunit MlaD